MKTWPEYEVMENENIKQLAAKYSVSWKLLVKANKLKAPYVLEAGKKIKVPEK